jgi:hypothetical protein
MPVMVWWKFAYKSEKSIVLRVVMSDRIPQLSYLLVIFPKSRFQMGNTSGKIDDYGD